ncbi:MAG TPA: DUF3570 domain-containing protein [Verrucomicrobia bacterium]|nr:DUF3570 domain-containing protein [Verrucomicrobiales bacterium]HIL54845.1 DUF3570 domain-containing protein [Verrucomicrobiota bacterium]
MISNYHRPIILTCLLPWVSSRANELGQEYDYGFQIYDEGSERIRVEANYFRGKIDLSDESTFKFQLLNDAITGSSPTGALPGGNQPFTSDLEDVRTGILAALGHSLGDQRLELELSKSEESDYFSSGISINYEKDYNLGNTTLAFGFNYLDDVVKVPFLDDEKKDSYDIFAGVTQLLGKNTVVSADLTLGYAEGYLNDPYKVVQRNEDFVIAPGISVPIVNIYRENRPDSRTRQVLHQETKHYFESLKGTLKAAFRLSNDDYGIFSQTAEVEWRQEVNDKLLISPFYRFYNQNSADFFVKSLNQLNIDTPAYEPNGSSPNYSADYRLSSLRSTSIGLKINYKVNENLSVSGAYEHYAMEGVGTDSAPSQAYPTANTFSITAQIKF